MPRQRKYEPAGERRLTVAEMEEIMIFLAEIIDEGLTGAQPILDYLERRYIAAKSQTTQSDRIKKLMAKVANQHQT